MSTETAGTFSESHKSILFMILENSSLPHLLIIGFGSVSQCALPLIIDLLLSKQHITSITILDALDVREKLRSYLNQYRSIKFSQEILTEDNYEEILSKYLIANDILLDLAFNLETRCLLKWCHHHHVRFVNTSVELWNPFEHDDPRQSTLYYRYVKLIEMQNEPFWKRNGPTAIIDHGCNPGLVSHFVKRALIDMTGYVLVNSLTPVSANHRHALEQALEEKNYPRLAYLLEIKTIHISERDTQISNQPKQVNEFVNTWSVDGLLEEAIAPAELGWGTHERNIPPELSFHQDDKGPDNLVYLKRKGMNTWVNILHVLSSH